MKINKVIYQIGVILFLSLPIMLVEAQQVKLYDQPPSADEIGRVLFSSQEHRPTRYRGVDFAPKTNSAVTTSQTNTAEKVSIAFPIEFAFNSAEITPDSKPYLDEIGKMLASSNFIEKRLIIEGHTDAKGPDRYNQYLSERRARAVSNFLIQNYGITSSRLQVVGMGEARPLPGMNPYDQLNRRVEFFGE